MVVYGLLTLKKLNLFSSFFLVFGIAKLRIIGSDVRLHHGCRLKTCMFFRFRSPVLLAISLFISFASLVPLSWLVNSRDQFITLKYRLVPFNDATADELKLNIRVYLASEARQII